MLVNNNVNDKRFIDHSRARKIRTDNDRQGFNLEPLAQEVSIPDSVYESESFQKLLDAGDVTVVSFDRDNSSPVTQGEFNRELGGVYKAVFVGTPFSAIAGPFTASSLTSGVPEVFDLNGRKFLRLGFNDVGGDFAFTHQFELPDNIFSAAEFVDFFNNDPVFSKWGVASVEVIATKNHIKLESKAKGTSSLIAVLDLIENTPTELNANDVLEFPTASTPGTGTPSIIELLVKSPSANVKSGAELTLGVYDAATGGSLVATAEWQVVNNGVVVSGNHTNEIVIQSDIEGKIKLELIDTGASGTRHVEAAKDADFFLSEVPASRESVTVS